jgi:hypothetical protein
MKIIREIATKIVAAYLPDDAEIILSEASLSGTVTNININSLEFEVIENVNFAEALPPYSALVYDNGFYPLDQAEYDLRKAEEEAYQRKQSILHDIASIEATITSRRSREAILNIDNGWLANAESKIAQLRQQLTQS